MAFKDMVEADIHGVFLNLDEFAEKRNVWYDGVTYRDVPIVLHGLKENDRKRLTSGVKEQGGRNSIADRVEGLYNEQRVAHLAVADIGGVLPENGRQIRISVSGARDRRGSGATGSRRRSLTWGCAGWSWGC